MASATSLSRSPRIQELMDRIRGLVAEERRLERDGRRELAAAVRMEITGMQERLAELVMRELKSAAV